MEAKKIGDTGICITKAWPGDSNVLEFLYGNRQFCDIFCIKEGVLPGKNINCIIPTILAEHHDNMVKRFY